MDWQAAPGGAGRGVVTVVPRRRVLVVPAVMPCLTGAGPPQFGSTPVLVASTRVRRSRASRRAGRVMGARSIGGSDSCLKRRLTILQGAPRATR